MSTGCQPSLTSSDVHPMMLQRCAFQGKESKSISSAASKGHPARRAKLQQPLPTAHADADNHFGLGAGLPKAVWTLSQVPV